MKQATERSATGTKGQIGPEDSFQSVVEKDTKSNPKTVPFPFFWSSAERIKLLKGFIVY